MSKLRYFFKDNIKGDAGFKTKSVFVTDRFRDEEGNIIPWKIREVSSRTLRRLQDQAIVSTDDSMEFDSDGYMENLIVESVVEPDLHNAELQDSFGVMNAKDLLNELVPGASDYSALTKEVNKINKASDFTKLIKEAKNS